MRGVIKLGQKTKYKVKNKADKTLPGALNGVFMDLLSFLNKALKPLCVKYVYTPYAKIIYTFKSLNILNNFRQRNEVKVSESLHFYESDSESGDDTYMSELSYCNFKYKQLGTCSVNLVRFLLNSGVR